MKNKVICKIAQITMFSYLVFGASTIFASTSQISHPSKSNSSVAVGSKKSQFLYVSQKLREFKLPKALAVIPIIESRYNLRAVSPKGAGGLWQLMPATAKQFGISSKARFQLEPSTVAALNYFTQLHRKFGNWEFAIAAYNAGDGRVLRAMKKNPSAIHIQQLSLPKETKQYVQKFYQMQGQLKAFTA